MVWIALPLYDIHDFPIFHSFYLDLFKFILFASICKLIGGCYFRYLKNLYSQYGSNWLVWKLTWTILAFIGWDCCGQYVTSVTFSFIFKGPLNFWFSLRIRKPSSWEWFFVNSSTLTVSWNFKESVICWHKWKLFDSVPDYAVGELCSLESRPERLWYWLIIWTHAINWKYFWIHAIIDKERSAKHSIVHRRAVSYLNINSVLSQLSFA